METVEPAVVVRGDVVSVLSVPGVVTATPGYVVLAEVDEQPVWHARLQAGNPVQAGTPVARQGDSDLVAPVGSYLVEWLVPHGVPVHKGVPVALLRYAGFGITAAVPPEEAYRLYQGAASARAQVTGGPGPTECEPLPVPGPAGLDTAPAGDTAQPRMEVLCALPKGIEVLAGAPAALGLNTGERTDVLLLPAAAVAGSAGHGTVARLVAGQPVLTEVTLGLTDGVNVEIVDGLAEGDQVWPYGPNLLPVVR